ncbi:hypothetical protein [Chryseobacterium sp. YIM B08800]|uniref:hypothetical protein n=1 Tax=Chryseobacterium sp. YIM B08800 TaxID=2984136 RepID=UPI002240C583|nr:hypothetical protein [Chryseobacterium sp. YIM B08800]
MKIFFVRKGVPLSKGIQYLSLRRNLNDSIKDSWLDSFRMTNFVFISILKNNDCNPSLDWNDILFGCGWSEAEPVTKKIQWKAGKSFKIKKWSIMKIKNSLLTIY